MTRRSRDLAGALLAVAALAAASEAFAQTIACGEAIVRCCATPGASVPRPAAAPPAFGVHIWPASLAKAPRAMEQLIALQPRRLRFALGPNWARQPPLRAAMTDDELDAFVGSGLAQSPLAAEIDALRLLKSRTGAALHLVIWAPPPLPSEIQTPAPHSRVLRRDDVAITARFHVALFRHLSARGFAADAVELSNEPDGDWNIRITPQNYLALLEAVRNESKRRGVASPPIYGPGASSVAATRAFLADPTIARAILDSIDTLSIHGWDNPAQRDRVVEFEALLDDLKRFPRMPAIALTEYGLARPEPADTSDRMNVKTRAPDSIANTQAYAIKTTRDMLRFYAAGVGTIIYWEFQDQSWGRASFGLLDEKGSKRPIFDAVATISRQLSEHGARNIAPAGASGLFMIERGDDDALASINDQREAKTILFTSGARAPQTVDCRDQKGRAGLFVKPWSLTITPIERH